MTHPDSDSDSVPVSIPVPVITSAHTPAPAHTPASASIPASVPVGEIRLPALLSTDQVASYLSVSHAVLQRWRKRKIGPPYLQAIERGNVMYPADELKKWLESRIQTEEGA